MMNFSYPRIHGNRYISKEASTQTPLMQRGSSIPPLLSYPDRALEFGGEVRGAAAGECALRRPLPAVRAAGRRRVPHASRLRRGEAAYRAKERVKWTAIEKTASSGCSRIRVQVDGP